MTYIRQGYAELVRYTLKGDLGNKVISEPLNWNEDEKEFKRSTDVHGVFINLSNNLEFYTGDETNDGGYHWLKQTYDAYGINAVVLLVKEEKVNGRWSESYRGYLDYSTYSRKNNKIKIKFNESGLYEKIKARQSEKLEIGRLDTMDGGTLLPLETETVALDGRDIKIITQFVDSKSPDKKYITISSNLAKYESRVVPFELITEVSSNFSTISEIDVDENESTYGQGTSGNMFYDNADVNVDLTANIEIKANIISLGGNINWLRLDLVTYSNANNYNFKTYKTLKKVENFTSLDFVYSGVEEIELLQGESVCLAYHVKYSDSMFVTTNTSMLTVQEKRFWNKSTAKFLFPHEMLDRILHVITNEENTLYSKALARTDILNDKGLQKYESDGYAGYTGLTNGFWVREFNDENLTTSFKDFVESFDTVWQLGYGIEKIGLTERVRMEHISHFYQPTVTISLGSQPRDIERTVAADYFYSGIEIGYVKPSGDNLYEEAMGLDEYNIRNTYTTAISRVENVFEKKSKYRADSYGKEFARRKSIRGYPEEDTRYDKDVMLMDLKKGQGLNYEERKWTDDFEIPLNLITFVPELSLSTTGVYSPETATNLRFSPINLILRWGFLIKGGFEKYLNKRIRYGSSDGNSSLKTQKRLDLYPDAKEYSENGILPNGDDGNILNSDLDKSLFIPEYIEFKFPVSAELNKQINGSSVINGEKIMNYYGLVEFVNEDGLNEYGYLMELKPNGNGKWKLLKANKKATKRSYLDELLPKPEDQVGGGFDYDLDFDIN